MDKVCLAVAREAIAGRMSRLAEGRRKGAENEQARGFRMRGKEAGPDTEPGWVNQCFHRSTKLRQRRGFRVSTAGAPPRNDWPLSFPFGIPLDTGRGGELPQLRSALPCTAKARGGWVE